MSHIISHLVVRIPALLLALSLAGCLEYETTTTVRPDGSFVRSITVKGDSAALQTWDFKIPADSTWTIVERSRVDEKKWALRAERLFTSGDAWTVWSKDLDRRTLQCSVAVEKQFRFFTTRYCYTEKIASYNPFTLIPLTDYISPGELDMFLRFEVMKESYPSRGDSLALDDASDRFEEWEVRTRVESYFVALEKSLPASAGLTPERLHALKEDLAQHLLADSNDNSYEPQRMVTWARRTHEPALVRAIQKGSEELDAFYADIEFVQETGGDSYVSRVVMPGEITRTNGKREGTQTAAWDEYIAYAYVNDFTMTAESTVVNAWAFILTLGVIVGAPILVWVAWMVRRKKMERSGM